MSEQHTAGPAHIHRQRARTQGAGAHVFRNPITGLPFADERAQTLAPTAGANLVWVAAQHGHSVQVMRKRYAKWIPDADRGASLAAVNAALTGTDRAI